MRYLETGEDPDDQGVKFDVFSMRLHGSGLASLWSELRESVLDRWIRTCPGTRPFAWWQFDAPPALVTGHAGPFPGREPRRRLGGTGTPNFEVLNSAPWFWFGLPVMFVQPWMVEYYNGRARDVNGKPIETKYRDGDFTGRAIDPRNPPRFESQADYLERHGLLTRGERARLTPADFEPEVVANLGEVA